MRSYRFLSPGSHARIRAAYAEGESTGELAKAYGITHSHCSKIVHGTVGPRRTVGAAAGAWKDYGPRCKRGHARPAVRDRKARRCRKCAALRQAVYRYLKSRQSGHGVQAVL